jgi:hypothetical protein
MVRQDKARHGCEACDRDRGTVYVIYEDRHLCLECASIWRKDKGDKKDDK